MCKKEGAINPIEKIKEILEASETEDTIPPYRTLPPGHPAWVEEKAKKLEEFFLNELGNFREIANGRYQK